MKNKSIGYFVAVLAPLVFSFAFALDMYIPSVPDIVRDFHDTTAHVQLTLSLYMLMLGLGQLVVGPLSDRFGRKPVALISAIVFALASHVTSLARSVDVMIVCRMFEALGAAGMMVVAFAMVRDCFSDNMSAKVMSYLNSTIAVSPLFAPILGGYIGAMWGWRANFIALGLLGLVCVLSVLFMQKETHEKPRRVSFDLAVFSRYWILLKDANVLPFVFIAGCAISIFFCFFSISPFIIINILHIPKTHFGYYFAVLGVAFLLGSMLNGKLVSVVLPKTMLVVGVSLALIGSLMMFVMYHVMGVSLLEFLLPTLVAGVGASFMAGNAGALILQPYPEMAGSAAALLGAGEFVMSSIAGSVMMHGHIVSTNPYALTVLVLAMVSFACLLWAKLCAAD